jgi:carboxylate-amine ligase
VAEPEFTLGIEEEYFLVDRVTRDVVDDPPTTMLAECEARLAGQVGPEFLRSQIEVGTGICSGFDEARADLARLRRTMAEIAARHGVALLVAARPLEDYPQVEPAARLISVTAIVFIFGGAYVASAFALSVRSRGSV